MLTFYSRVRAARPQLRTDQRGLITMELVILIILAILIYFIYKRVAAAQR